MTIYLYVKTHLITNLRYLGKTTAKDPHKYTGSGVYWRLHLKKHGYLYKTEILKECNSKEEVRSWGLYYSDGVKVENKKTQAQTFNVQDPGPNNVCSDFI